MTRCLRTRRAPWIRPRSHGRRRLVRHAPAAFHPSPGFTLLARHTPAAVRRSPGFTVLVGLLRRIGAFFLEPPPVRVAQPSSGPTPVTAPLTAAVLGAPGAVVAVAAACAGELRARRRASAALVCIWRPAGPSRPASEADGPEPPARSPAGATTLGARRLANRLAAHELCATACGRLAWLRLDPHPETAATQVRRAQAVSGTPLALAVAGPRPPAFESLLETIDLAIAVLAPDAEPSLRALATAGLQARAAVILPPLAPGPPRWAAMAGLARLRALPGLTP